VGQPTVNCVTETELAGAAPALPAQTPTPETLWAVLTVRVVVPAALDSVTVHRLPWRCTLMFTGPETWTSLRPRAVLAPPAPTRPTNSSDFLARRCTSNRSRSPLGA